MYRGGVFILVKTSVIDISTPIEIVWVCHNIYGPGINGPEGPFMTT